jgi:hypothetical protein
MTEGPRNTPLRANTTALRTQYTPELGELISDDQEGRLYLGNAVKAGGLACWHTDLLDSGGARIIGGVGGGVNYLQVTAGVAGQPVRMQPAGADADAQLLLLSKGTKQVLAGRSGQHVPVNQRESDNPASGSNGEQLYRLDLSDQFWHRGAIAKWLSHYRDHLWTLNNTATGDFARAGALQATSTLGRRVDFSSTITGIGWNLTLTAAAASSALEIMRCDGVPNLLFSQAVGGTLSGYAAIDVEMTITSDYGLRWNDGGAGSNATGFVTLYVTRRALAA